MGEPLHETWLYFQKKLLQRPTHGLLDKVLLQAFYRVLDQMNKTMADNFAVCTIIFNLLVLHPLLLIEWQRQIELYILERTK